MVTTTTTNEQPGEPRASLLVEHWAKQTFAKYKWTVLSIEMGRLGKGSKKKSREKYGLLPNPGGVVAEGNEKTKLLFWKSIFSVSM